jgi:hypothetical protein
MINESDDCRTGRHDVHGLGLDTPEILKQGRTKTDGSQPLSCCGAALATGGWNLAKVTCRHKGTRLEGAGSHTDQADTMIMQRKRRLGILIPQKLHQHSYKRIPFR